MQTIGNLEKTNACQHVCVVCACVCVRVCVRVCARACLREHFARACLVRLPYTLYTLYGIRYTDAYAVRMPYTYASCTCACLIRLPYMHALCVCLTRMPYVCHLFPVSAGVWHVKTQIFHSVNNLCHLFPVFEGVWHVHQTHTHTHTARCYVSFWNPPSHLHLCVCIHTCDICMYVRACVCINRVYHMYVHTCLSV